MISTVNGFTAHLEMNALIVTVTQAITDIGNVVVGDTYTIELASCSLQPSTKSILVRPSRVSAVFGGAGGGFNEFDGFTGCSGCACFTNNRVPIVTISEQTTIDGEYLADILFTIHVVKLILLNLNRYCKLNLELVELSYRKLSKDLIIYR